MAFINLIPRDKSYTDSKHTYRIDNAIPLRVVMDDNVEMTPDVNIKVTDLSKGQKQFVNASGKGDRYNITILVHDDDTFVGTWTSRFKPSLSQRGPNGAAVWVDHFDYPTTLNVVDLLDWIIRSMLVVTLTSDNNEALIPNGAYIITKNPHRTQNYKNGYSLWELEFTKYTDVVESKYVKTSKGATKAINAYNKKQQKKKNGTTKKNSTTKAKQSASLNSQLKKCKVSQMKYSKTKKVTSCVKTLQKYLNKKGKGNLAVDGWYGNATKKAVKKFQTDFKKKYKLTANGKMDTKTLNAMVKE